MLDAGERAFGVDGDALEGRSFAAQKIDTDSSGIAVAPVGIDGEVHDLLREIGVALLVHVRRAANHIAEMQDRLGVLRIVEAWSVVGQLDDCSLIGIGWPLENAGIIPA